MCVECNNTGYIETQSITYGRLYWGKRGIMADVSGKGDWTKTICPCVGEEDCGCTASEVK